MRKKRESFNKIKYQTKKQFKIKYKMIKKEDVQKKEEEERKSKVKDVPDFNKIHQVFY